MDTRSQPWRPWFRPTLGRLLVALLAVEGFLLASERFVWFPFNEHKGWTVLIAVSLVIAALAVIFLGLLACLLFRRRVQFSLRSLFVLVVAVAVSCSWLAAEMKWASEQREAVERLGKLDAVVESDGPSGPAFLRSLLGEHFFTTVVGVSFPPSFPDAGLGHLERLTQLQELFLDGTQVTDAGLEHLKGLTQLLKLNLVDTPVTDAGLVHLKGLTQLGALYLGGTQITDAGLVQLKDLTQLGALYLDNTQVTDAGLEHLERLTQLQELFLGGTPVTDAGLVHLKEMAQLYWLHLDDTQVTDAGLEHLKGLTQLQELGLNGTRVTDAGLEHLQGLTQLRRLELNGTRVTDAGVKKLQHALGIEVPWSCHGAACGRAVNVVRVTV